MSSFKADRNVKIIKWADPPATKPTTVQPTAPVVVKKPVAQKPSEIQKSPTDLAQRHKQLPVQGPVYQPGKSSFSSGEDEPIPGDGDLDVDTVSEAKDAAIKKQADAAALSFLEKRAKENEAAAKTLYDAQHNDVQGADYSKQLKDEVTAETQTFIKLNGREPSQAESDAIRNRLEPIVKHEVESLRQLGWWSGPAFVQPNLGNKQPTVGDTFKAAVLPHMIGKGVDKNGQPIYEEESTPEYLLGAWNAAVTAPLSASGIPKALAQKAFGTMQGDKDESLLEALREDAKTAGALAKKTIKSGAEFSASHTFHGLTPDKTLGETLSDIGSVPVSERTYKAVSGRRTLNQDVEETGSTGTLIDAGQHAFVGSTADVAATMIDPLAAGLSLGFKGIRWVGQYGRVLEGATRNAREAELAVEALSKAKLENNMLRDAESLASKAGYESAVTRVAGEPIAQDLGEALKRAKTTAEAVSEKAGGYSENLSREVENRTLAALGDEARASKEVRAIVERAIESDIVKGELGLERSAVKPRPTTVKGLIEHIENSIAYNIEHGKGAAIAAAKSDREQLPTFLKAIGDAREKAILSIVDDLRAAPKQPNIFKDPETYGIRSPFSKTENKAGSYKALAELRAGKSLSRNVTSGAAEVIEKQMAEGKFKELSDAEVEKLKAIISKDVGTQIPDEVITSGALNADSMANIDRWVESVERKSSTPASNAKSARDVIVKRLKPDAISIHGTVGGRVVNAGEKVAEITGKYLGTAIFGMDENKEFIDAGLNTQIRQATVESVRTQEAVIGDVASLKNTDAMFEYLSGKPLRNKYDESNLITKGVNHFELYGQSVQVGLVDNSAKEKLALSFVPEDARLSQAQIDDLKSKLDGAMYSDAGVHVDAANEAIAEAQKSGVVPAELWDDLREAEKNKVTDAEAYINNIKKITNDVLQGTDYVAIEGDEGFRKAAAIIASQGASLPIYERLLGGGAVLTRVQYHDLVEYWSGGLESGAGLRSLDSAVGASRRDLRAPELGKGSNFQPKAIKPTEGLMADEAGDALRTEVQSRKEAERLEREISRQSERVSRAEELAASKKKAYDEYVNSNLDNLDREHTARLHNAFLKEADIVAKAKSVAASEKENLRKQIEENLAYLSKQRADRLSKVAEKESKAIAEYDAKHEALIAGETSRKEESLKAIVAIENKRANAENLANKGKKQIDDYIQANLGKLDEKETAKLASLKRDKDNIITAANEEAARAKQKIQQDVNARIEFINKKAAERAEFVNKLEKNVADLHAKSDATISKKLEADRFYDVAQRNTEEAVSGQEAFKISTISDNTRKMFPNVVEAVDSGILIPKLTRDALDKVLTNAIAKQTDKGSILSVMLRIFQRGSTRGINFLSVRHHYNNLWGDMEQIYISHGAAVAARSQIENILQEIMATPFVGQGFQIAQRNLTIGQSAQRSGLAIVEDIVSAIKNKTKDLKMMAKKSGSVIDDLLYVGQSSPDVNLLLDGEAIGKNGEKITHIRMGNRSYKVTELRDAMVRGGVLDSLDISELAKQVNVAAKDKSKIASVLEYVGGDNPIGRASGEIAEQISQRRRVGLFKILLEKGATPEAAARGVVEALYDYKHSLVDGERGLIRYLVPFWSWQKNNNRQMIAAVLTPQGSARIRRYYSVMKDLSEDINTHNNAYDRYDTMTDNMMNDNPATYAKYLNDIALLKANGYDDAFIRLNIRDVSQQFIGNSADGKWPGVSLADRLLFKDYISEGGASLYSPNINEMDMSYSNYGRPGLKFKGSIKEGATFGDFTSFLLPPSGIDAALTWSAKMGSVVTSAGLSLYGVASGTTNAQSTATAIQDVIPLDSVPGLNLFLGNVGWSSKKSPTAKVQSETIGNRLMKYDLARDTEKGVIIDNPVEYYFWNYTSAGVGIREIDKANYAIESLATIGIKLSERHMTLNPKYKIMMGDIAAFLSSWVGPSSVVTNEPTVRNIKGYISNNQANVHGVGVSKKLTADESDINQTLEPTTPMEK